MQTGIKQDIEAKYPQFKQYVGNPTLKWTGYKNN